MSWRLGCGVAILGAFLAQPAAFFLAFLWGVIFGAGEIMASGPGHHTTGLEGGERAIGNLGFVYVISIGVVPIVISLVGAVSCVVLAFAIRWLRSTGNSDATKSPTE